MGQAIGLSTRALAFATRKMMGTITQVATGEPVAALTFDDGPDPEITPRVIDILERHGAHGTFFMLGMHAAKHPQLVRRVGEGGHAIGNHSWDHSSFPLITRQERRRQLRACAEVLAGRGLRLFRPPYGEQSFLSHMDARWLGYEVVAWSLDVGDWWNADAGHMAGELGRRVQPGSIVLLHDTLYQNPGSQPALSRQPHRDREAMLEALDIFLDGAAERFRFVTLPELFRRGRLERRNWYRTTGAS